MSNAQVQKSAPVALITGGGGAIAGATARLLDQKGYRLILLDRDAGRMGKVADGLSRPAAQLVCDLASREQVERAVAGVVAQCPALDVLVHVAGYGEPGDVCDAPSAEIDRHLDINLRAVMQLTAGLAPAMRERGAGSIVSIASMAAIIPLPGSAYYTAAKFGLRGYMAALHMELRSHGVRVTCICPSAVDTPMLEREMEHDGSPLNFLGRLSAPEDVARAVLRAIRTGRMEIYVPYEDSLGARLVNMFPWLLPPLLPWLERLGRRGAKKYLVQKGPRLPPTTNAAPDHARREG